MGVKRVVKKGGSGKTIVTIGEALAAFEKEKLVEGVVSKTINNYKQSLSFFKEFAKLDDNADITLINRNLVIAWVNSMMPKEGDAVEEILSTSSINHYIRDVRAFLYWCMNSERRYLENFKVSEIHAQEPPPKTYTAEDIKRLLAKPKASEELDFVAWRNWAIVNLIYDMGGRCATIIDIQLRDVNLVKRSIYLRHTKNKSLSHMVISSTCVKVLKDYIKEWRADAKEEDYLFCNYSNEQLTYNALAHSFTAYCKKRGVERHSLHGLRHNFATELAENTNGDMIRLQKALGHKSIDMARRYVNMANIDMGNYDEVSPLAKKKDKRGRPKRKV